MIHSITIFTYGVYLDRQYLIPLTTVFHPLKLMDIVNLEASHELQRIISLELFDEKNT